MIYILWEFKISSRHRAEFEEAYCSDGVWSQLFRRDPNYVKTILLKGSDGELGRYMTLDVWKNGEAYSQFKRRFAHEYSEVDSHCEALTESERLIGIFDEIA